MLLLLLVLVLVQTSCIVCVWVHPSPIFDRRAV